MGGSVKKQGNEFDYYNALLCLMVIFIHVSSEPSARYRRDSFLYLGLFVVLKLFSFAVPAFIMVSGFKFSRSVRPEGFDYKKYLLRRARKILIPYLIAASVFYFYFIYRGFEVFGWDIWGKGLLFGTIAAPFYFVVTIFQFYLLAPLWLLIARKVSGKTAIPVALAVTVFSKFFLPGLIAAHAPDSSLNLLIQYNDRIFISYLLYWAIGVYLGKETPPLLRRETLVFAVGLPILAVHVWLSYLSGAGQFFYRYAEVVHVFFCAALVLMGYLIIRRMSEKMARLQKIALWLCGLSFSIYLWHCLFIYIADDLFYRLGITSVSFRYALRFLFVYATSIAFCAYLQWLRHIIGHFTAERRGINNSKP